MSSSLRPKELVQKLARAWLERDRHTINSILADEWTVIDPAGRLLSKAEILGEFDSGIRKLTSATVDEIHERDFGDVCLVTGRTIAEGIYLGKGVAARLRFTDVFVLREGRWLVVSSQATLIAD